ncbi:unnamed protein product [Brassicogethes aeneus]|uniref:Glutamate/phenylalanine/leucine/valine/L-tryptophan dehydrogenase C-terminal domain-containing protein n=1 Tax=Brassicogethes aeneus TaxID=1431903 RepID=A0A9P0FEK4_BRAAE|nr:unnamed protein product [Brassicogethes aeneus]
MGLGKTGKKLAQYLVDNGAICVGVKETDAYIYNSNGIDIKELFSYFEEHSSFKNFSMAIPESNDKIFQEKCDILIFAANHKSLICYVADKVKAKLIVEAADSPISPGSHRILSHSKMVIPDIFACAGCTIASALEYMQNLKQVNSPLNDMLKYSDKIYEELSNGLCIHSEQKIASPFSVQKISSHKINSDVLENTIKKITENVGKEIIGTIKEFQLGHDVRSAAYIVSLQKMYNKMYATQRFL